MPVRMSGGAWRAKREPCLGILSVGAQAQSGPEAHRPGAVPNRLTDPVQC